MILDFVWFHFLRPTGKHPQSEGRNLILHGRSEKLKGAIEETQSAKPKRTGNVQNVVYFLVDTSRAGADFRGIARFKGLNVTSFANDAGAFATRPERFEDSIPS